MLRTQCTHAEKLSVRASIQPEVMCMQMQWEALGASFASDTTGYRPELRQSLRAELTAFALACKGSPPWDRNLTVLG